MNLRNLSKIFFQRVQASALVSANIVAGLIACLWIQQTQAFPDFLGNEAAKMNPPKKTAEQCPRYAPPESVYRRIRKVNINPCQGEATSLVEWTRLHVLFLCQNGELVKSYDIALGRGGIYKTKEGDLKTPIGVYPVGAPTKSEQFGTFIPVGYPTPQEVEKGYTGDAIGIHGPDRRFRCAGFLNVAIDWTQGCQAVASDNQINEIAAWIRTRRKEGPLFISIVDELSQLAPDPTIKVIESETAQ